MGETSTIEWTDATVNFWHGCTKVNSACDHCYAETLDARFGGNHWGIGAPRRKIASATKLIHKLDNGYAEWAADYEVAVGNAKAFGLPVPNIGRRRRVFIQSMSDLFDLEVELAWFREGWEHIEACNRIDIQIVTKRVSVIEKRLAAIGVTVWPRHVGLMISIGDQQDADRDVPRLLALKTYFDIPWVGLSVEPLLGAIDLRNHRVCDHCENTPYNLFKNDPLCPHPMPVHDSQQCPLHWWPSDGCDGTLRHKIDWVIVGGESGPKARPMHPDWARGLRDQCADANVPFLYKQWGAFAPVEITADEFANPPPHREGGFFLFLASVASIFWFAFDQGFRGFGYIHLWGQFVVGLFLTIAVQGGRLYRALTGRVPVAADTEVHHH